MLYITWIYSVLEFWDRSIISTVLKIITEVILVFRSMISKVIMKLFLIVYLVIWYNKSYSESCQAWV